MLGVLVAALFLTGCGAVITGAVAGIFAGSSHGGGSGASVPPPTPNTPATVPSASVVGDTSLGTVTLDFTLTDPESDAITVEIHYSLDPNENAAQPFKSVATGTIQTQTGATVSANAVPSSPGGTPYVFIWNTSQDLGATRNTEVRLQVVIGGEPTDSSNTATTPLGVAATTAAFVVDNTPIPVVNSADVAPPPSGASEYADLQNGSPGFVPVNFTVSQGQSANVSMKILFSTDGGATFSDTNVADGQIFDSSGNEISQSAVPTSSSGIAYVFHFHSSANNLGLTGSQSIVLRFQATATKKSKNVKTSQFSVNNAFFTGVLSTPVGAQIADNVTLRYLLIDQSAKTLNVTFQWGVPGLGPLSCTSLPIPPSPKTTTGLAASARGTPYAFIWNAYFDMVVSNNVPASSQVGVSMFVTRASTQVTIGPIPTSQFSIDYRLINTCFARTAGVDDNIAATAAELGVVQGIASFGTKIYFADVITRRVRVVDTSTGLIDTALGGGFFTNDGAQAKEFAVEVAQDVAVSTKSPGTFYGSVRVLDGTNRLVRVDGTTPLVTTLYTYGGRPGECCYEATNDAVIAYDNNALAPFPPGTGFIAVNGSNGSQMPALEFAFAPGALGVGAVTANFAIFPDIVLFTDPATRRLLARNTNPVTPRNFWGVALPANTTTVVQTFNLGFNNTQGQCVGVSIASANSVLIVLQDLNRVVSMDAAGVITDVAGSAQGFIGFSGDGGAATSARLAVPFGVAATGPTSFAISDLGNTRIRGVNAGTITTIAGTFGDLGDGRPSVPSQLRGPTSLLPVPGGLLIADKSLSRIRRVASSNDLITTFAGTGQSGVAGDGGSAVSAFVGGPIGLALAPSGDVFVSQPDDQVVRRISASTISTFAGQVGNFGNSPDGTASATALLGGPSALGMTGNTLLIAQFSGIVSAANLDPVNPVNVANVAINPGTMSRIVGGGGTLPANGVVARNTMCGAPIGVCADNAGNIFVADRDEHCVFMVDAAGNDTMITGTANNPGPPSGENVNAAAELISTPIGVALNSASAPKWLYVYMVGGGASPARLRVVNLTNIAAFGPAATIMIHGHSVGPGNIQSIAGTNNTGFSADGVLGTTSELNPSPGAGANLCVSGGSVFFGDADNGRARFVDAAGTIRTLAGEGSIGGDFVFTADNCNLTRPTAITTMPDGTYLVMDLGRIRGVPPSTQLTTRRAGTSLQFYGGDGFNALVGSFDYVYTSNFFNDLCVAPGIDVSGPRQMSFSAVSNLLAVADTRDHMIRLVNLGATAFTLGATITLPAGNVMRLAGTVNVAGAPQPSFAGDNLAVSGTITQLDAPQGAVFTDTGVLIVADTNNDRIRAINLTASTVTLDGVAIPSGFINTIASNTGNTPFVKPRNIAFDPLTKGIVFQHDLPGGGTTPAVSFLNITAGLVNAFGTNNIPVGPGAGSMIRIDGQATGNADLIRGVAIDPVRGDCFFCFTSNSQVFGVSHSASPLQSVRIAGQAGAPPGNPGFSGDGGVATSAQLNNPTAIAVDAFGSIYILDTNNRRVRRCRRFP